MQNGSVDDALHGRRPPEAAGPVRLDWAARTRLGCEAAAALQHLHTAHPMPIVHGRLQPSTILLDEHLRGRLGDAGVAATFGARQVRQPGRRYIPSCNVIIWEVAARKACISPWPALFLTYAMDTVTAAWYSEASDSFRSIRPHNLPGIQRHGFWFHLGG